MSAVATPSRRRAQPDVPPPEDANEAPALNPVLAFLHRFGTAPAWLTSLTLHIIVLATLSTIVYYPPHEMLQAVITTEMTDLEEAQPIVMDNVRVDTIGTNSTVQMSGAAFSAATGQISTDPQTEVESRIEEEIAPVQVAISDDVVQDIPQGDLTQRVNTSGSAATENTGGTQGAIDRLTFELLSSLRENKTLVLWMFDASLSLKERRNLIADRFQNVYTQLEALDGVASKHLKTAIATFGQKTQILTPEPVDGIKEIVPLVRGIKNDESGKENTFSSLVQVGKKFQNYALNSGRKLIVIVVTDEKGDDAPQFLEEAIILFRKPGTRCFVVGNASPFGKEKGYMTWTYEDGEKEERPVDQGPETLYPDVLQLPFFGINGNDLDRMSAGYGPYALTRLCTETGGTYLIAEEAKGRRYDPHIMRNYQPDYRPIRVVEQDIKKNKAKYALREAARNTGVDAIAIPNLTFPANNDNELREAISEAQKPMAVTDNKVGLMLGILEAGEKDRDKITEPRWQAAYDLAIGRALAMRARTLGYNMVLADMKLNPKSFTKKGYNQWVLKPAKEVNVVEIKKKSSKATMYLKRVIDLHPDTPWAEIAERELSQPMGWGWTESIDAAGRLAMATPQERKAILLLAEEQKKKQAMKQEKKEKRQPPNL